MFNVLDSLDFLKREGFPVVKGVKVSSKSELLSACRIVGFPLVLKIVSGEHKTDVGGVVTSVFSVKEALSAFSKLRRLSRDVLVQEQAGGLELVLGIKKDSVFNQVIMFGLGGVFIEVLKDVSFRVCPVSREDALSMINELKGSVLLKGYRGKEGVDVNVLADLIVKLSEVAVSKDVKELDINPLFGKGKELLIVDARLEL